MKHQGATEDRVLVLLKGVSGAFSPGVLTALMGVSGASKTTLMDVLAEPKTGGYTEGNIKISGLQNHGLNECCSPVIQRIKKPLLGFLETVNRTTSILLMLHFLSHFSTRHGCVWTQKLRKVD
ncbi:Uncharacterized protein Fot_55511 [Forsythia ovata]|uniref:ABC transporter domain-containing protein n=1 Tax=Forsythia ovata TaxID=205694 RepID=A0ABD1P4W7_9LAMI